MPNNFTCDWMNRHDEHGRTWMDVVITHNEGTIPPRRFQRKWAIDPALITDQFLADDAVTLVEQIIEEWNAEQAAQPEEPGE